MANELTDRDFWKNYWESKSDLIVQIPKNHTFFQIINQITNQHKIDTAIELGGFPGYYAVFLKKYYQIDATLLDYFVYPELTQKLLVKNDLDTSSISVIEADLFNYEVTKKYDLVLSCGLIEHFEDTKAIIKSHVQFLNKGGKLLITLPNFTGVNGWVQQKFDNENYLKHNIKSMNPVLLTQIANELQLKNVKVYYYGKFSTWLENKSQKSAFTKATVKTIWYLGKIITKIIPIESKILSPYIVLEANI